MQTTCKLEGGGGQKFGKFANVICERPLVNLLTARQWGTLLENFGIQSFSAKSRIIGVIDSHFLCFTMHTQSRVLRLSDEYNCKANDLCFYEY